MKRAISILLLLVVLFLLIEFIVTRFTSNHSITYDVYNGDMKFSVKEEYSKKNNDSYTISISKDNYNFYYIVANNYNKQKKIVDKIEYFKDGNNLCIYPVFKDKQETYILCSDTNNIYSSYTYANQEFINSIKNKLIESKYITVKHAPVEDKVTYDNSTVYKHNLNNKDSIIYWKYKGIDILRKDKQTNVTVLEFDRYENKVGYLVDNYYIVPNYTNQKVLEFNSVTAINVKSGDKKKIDLDMILSSDTYINGVVDNKLYYTDPSNLLQVEIKPSNSNVRLIGDSSMGGQMYDGQWKDANIYDFKSSEIKYKDNIDVGFTYKDIKEGNGCYYIYTEDGSIYQVLKDYSNKPILLYKATGLSNFNVVENDIYYVIESGVYNFNLMDGNRLVMENKDLIYNNINRIQVYRNKAS